MKKKTITAWTYKNWSDHFILTRDSFSWPTFAKLRKQIFTVTPNRRVKVRITIEEVD